MMRRASMLALLLALTTAVFPQSVDARPRVLGAILGVVTKPFGAILGAGRHAGRRTVHRRGHVRHVRKAAPVAATAAVGATAATAAASAARPPAPAETAPPASSNAGENNEPTAPEAHAVAGDTSEANASAAETSSAHASDGQSEASANEAAGKADAIQHTTLATAQPDDLPTSPAPGKSRLGMVGPPIWPTALEDAIGYALWPKAYGARLRAHGIGDVLATAFTPGAVLLARSQSGSPGAQAKTSGSGGAGGVCGHVAAVSPDWPSADIERTLKLDEQQRAALNDLRSTIDSAAATVRATCRDEATPVDRLRAMQNTLWAVHDAVQTIRAPLAKFYDRLSDAQRKQFAPPSQAQSNAEVRTCGMPSGHETPLRRLQDSLHISKTQHPSLESLYKKSFEMGQFLMASCFKPTAPTPAERLDAAADRLTAVLFAASNLNMALNEFTAHLDSDQKAKLNSIGW